MIPARLPHGIFGGLNWICVGEYIRTSNTSWYRQTVSCTRDISDVNELENCPALSTFTFGLKCVMLGLRRG